MKIVLFIGMMQSSDNKIWVLLITTESGDTLNPLLFREKPSNQELKEILINKYPEEFYDDGPGVFGGYIHIDWKQGETI